MNIKVAIVEDHKQLREGLSELIKHAQGFELACVLPNAIDIIASLDNLAIDVILMDIQMPVISGIEAVKLMKQQRPEVKIIMQTVFEDNERIFQSVCAGANGYILKNTSPEKYLDAITEAFYGGAPMTPVIATKVLNLFRVRPEANEPDYDLTDREKEVLHCLVKGKSYKMIADECEISYATVRFHMKNIYAKLHVASMTEAVAKALKSNIF